MQKPTTNELIKAIEKSRGNVSAIARLYERPRSTVQTWIDNSALAARALEDSRETRVDTAETTIYKAAAEENLSAAFYILNNDPRAKKRGWGPRMELTGADGGPIPITYIKENRADD
jgi:transposase-like protein